MATPSRLSLVLLGALGAFGSLNATGCVAAKAARLGAEEAIQPRFVERISTAGAGPVEIRCGVGELCEEIRVVHVQRDVDGGVDVTLMNRTGDNVAVQLQFEGFDAQQRRKDRSTFHDVVLAPRGEQVLHLDLEVPVNDTLVLHLRSRV